MTPSRWLALSVRRPSDDEAAALLAEALLALGGRAVEEDGGWLVTHVPDPADPDALVRRAGAALRALSGQADLTCDASWQAHEDWAETWKRGLAPRRVTPRLVVTPSWEAPAAGPDDVVVTLDPGMAFGNAEHGTTRGCLRLLDGVLTPGERVLDVGTGSAVLAIAAALLGAREVVALEGDPLACETAAENLARNGVRERVELRQGWADDASLTALGSFDGVVANLEGATLHRLLSALAARARPGGWLILSGVLEGELDGLVTAAAARGLSRDAVDADGEWRTALLSRRG